MGKALRRRTWRKSPRTVFYGAIAWSILGLVFALIVTGFVLVFVVAFS